VQHPPDTDDVPTIDALMRSIDFASFLEALGDGVLVCDDKLILRATNRMAAQLLGLDDAAIGLSLDVLSEKMQIDWSSRTVTGSQIRARDFMLRADGQRAIMVSERPFNALTEGHKAVLFILRDLQLLDHKRQNIAGKTDRKVFKFLIDRDSRPDFEAQRRVSPAIDIALNHGERALRQGARLLFIGESGCGKTELAQSLHRTVGMPEESFVHVNCGAIPDALFESEMFGYERGAFTGALASGNRGLIEAAEGGTLFLDEVGEIPLNLQAKLLKFLEDGMVQRVGGRSERRISSRIIAATNRDLRQLVSTGEFRQDLYYRLAVFTLDIPPLREQPGLKGHLIDHFVSAANRVRSPHLKLSAGCRDALMRYRCPGNIRELHNLIQHLSIVAVDIAELEHLPIHVTDAHAESSIGDPTLADEELGQTETPLKSRVREFERGVIDGAIERYGSKRKAARALGVDIGTIVRKTR
jgi:transcriptional regulator with PAS, ATPase and Fis domain